MCSRSNRRSCSRSGFSPSRLGRDFKSKTGTLKRWRRAEFNIWSKSWPESLRAKKGRFVLAMGRQRSISLIGELLFQSELERKALLMPEENLKKKIAAFESSVARFESERQTLSDFLSIDRQRLLKELETETERLWKEAQKEMRQLVGEITAPPFNEKATFVRTRRI